MPASIALPRRPDLSGDSKKSGNRVTILNLKKALYGIYINAPVFDSGRIDHGTHKRDHPVFAGDVRDDEDVPRPGLENIGHFAEKGAADKNFTPYKVVIIITVIFEEVFSRFLGRAFININGAALYRGGVVSVADPIETDQGRFTFLFRELLNPVF